jgi:hypothetical protein
MAEQTVQLAAAPAKPPLVLITPAEARRRRACSRSQEYYERKHNPDWPQPIEVNGRLFYIEAEFERFLENLVELGRIPNSNT